MRKYGLNVRIIDERKKANCNIYRYMFQPPIYTRPEISLIEMYMTKHDIVMWHRKMWTWIAVKHYMGDKRPLIYLKEDFLRKHHFDKVKAACFLCDEVATDQVKCSSCLLKWPNTGYCTPGLYYDLAEAIGRVDKSKNSRPYQFLALKELEIAMLPLNPLQEVRL